MILCDKFLFTQNVDRKHSSFQPQFMCFDHPPLIILRTITAFIVYKLQMIFVLNQSSSRPISESLSVKFSFRRVFCLIRSQTGNSLTFPSECPMLIFRVICLLQCKSKKKDFNNSFKKNELSFGSVSPVVKTQKCAKYP